MPSVKTRENEPFEFALRRFKRTCEKNFTKNQRKNVSVKRLPLLSVKFAVVRAISPSANACFDFSLSACARARKPVAPRVSGFLCFSHLY